MDTTANSSRPLGGRFVWHELLSTDPERSAKFYSELLGWRMEAGEDIHAVFHHGRHGRRVASLVGVGRRKPGTASCWLACVTVDDVEHLAVRLQGEMRGVVGLPPAKVGGGRHAVLADSRGALLAAFEPGASKEPLEEYLPADPDELRQGCIRMPPPGHFCWDQLNTRDLDAAVQEYEALLPWTVQHHDDGVAPGATFWRGDCATAGALQMTDDESAGSAAPDHWLPFVRVASVKKAAETARGLGGRVVVEPDCDAERGCFAVLQDPTGAVIAVCDPPPPDAGIENTKSTAAQA